jgi:hypothetical protein
VESHQLCNENYFFMSGGRPAEPCWPMGRSASCSKGSLVWGGGMFLFFRLFSGGVFLVFRFRLRLTAISVSSIEGTTE